MAKLVHPKLSYEVVGVLYEVYNELGGGYQEKYYQRAISGLLKEKNIIFKEQVPVELMFKEKSIGRYFIDFVIEEKIILEI